MRETGKPRVVFCLLAGLLFRKVPARLLHLILGGVILAGGVRLLVC